MRGEQASACPAGTKADKATQANGQLLQVGGGWRRGAAGGATCHVVHGSLR